ncbi:hypothetical protein [Clostridium estertheticum]|uniref:hypothetical protein n=1 Tax=Clostridium estertheticum TaxID=238834 RepID=UPI001C0E7468|nr:hypothetical protein [Clostridium estertheticum]MBU3186578.1 hypothetical protein [Clostridium estertheticum]
MNNKSAKVIIDGMYNYWKDNAMTFSEMKALEKSSEALDKQISKKVYFDDLDVALVCPRCIENVNLWTKDNCEDNPKYCPNCGQKLIW